MSRLEFTAPTKRKAYERARGECQCCGTKLPDGSAHYHHILEARLGGDNSLANCLVLCIPCHKVVTKEVSVPRVTKMKGMHAGSINARTATAKIAQRPKEPRAVAEKLAIPPRRNIYTGKPFA